jgi:D-alanine-D-alanine ligase
MQFYSRTQLNGDYKGGEPKEPPWRIVLAANYKGVLDWDPAGPADAGAEFDAHSTLLAISAALEADGHQVTTCFADHTLPVALENLRPDFVFNIAEGIGADAREALVPALCALLNIPYTASQVLTQAISLDKVQTKRIWQTYGLPTARFQEFHHADEPLDPALNFPMFVKPAREGTGMGMTQNSIVDNETQMREQIDWVLATYHQPTLVEEYLQGREFTVGFIGNRGFPAERRRPELYNFDGYHFFPVLEIDGSGSVTPGVYGNAAKSLDITAAGAPAYLCPADISTDLQEQLVSLTRKASEALGVVDVARVDFRLNADGEPQLLEINTLPGLNPDVSDICIMAEAEGIPYQVLITEILYLAAERYNLSLPHIQPDRRLGMEQYLHKFDSAGMLNGSTAVRIQNF